MSKNAQFYIVPTPIGNLGDITLRAIEILKSVDVIACEDSRVTQKLLNHYEVKTKTISYHKFNERERVNLFLDLLKEGKTVALVSDAGMPLICDPGAVLVEELRKQDIKVSALAGASALTTFLAQVPKGVGKCASDNSQKSSASFSGSEEFAFVGFMPKSENQIFALLQKYSHTNLVFYESPNRLLKTLEKIKEFDEGSKVAVGRELTKVFEEVVADNVSNIIDYYKKNVLKGEIVAMVYRQEGAEFSQTELLEKIEKLKRRKFGAKDISTILADLYGLNKNDIYKMVI